MSFVYHPKKAVYSSSQEMQAMQPILLWQMAIQKEEFIYRVPIPSSDWTLITWRTSDASVAASLLFIGLIGFDAVFNRVDLFCVCGSNPYEPSNHHLRIGAGDTREAVAKGSQIGGLAQAFNSMLDKSITSYSRLEEARRTAVRAAGTLLN